MTRTLVNGQNLGSHLIYALIDPLTSMVRYIGKSSTGLKRPYEHARLSRLQRCSATMRDWLEQLRTTDLSYDVVVLEYVEDPTSSATPLRSHWEQRLNITRLNDAEIWWIAYGRASGWPLFNKASGGIGSAGFRRTNESRDLMRAAHLGKKLTPVHRARIGAAGTGRRHSLETRAKMSVAATGRTIPNDVRAKISASTKLNMTSADYLMKLRMAKLGKVFTPEHRAKIGAGLRKSYLTGARTPK